MFDFEIKKEIYEETEDEREKNIISRKIKIQL